jgi:zinc transporter
MTDPVLEARDEGLRHAFALDGHGGGRALLWSDIEHHEPSDPPVWIDLLFDREPARAWIARQMDIPAVAREAMVESQSRPGMFEYDNGFLLIIRGVNLNEGARPEDMISLRIWIDEFRVITCRRRILQSVRSVAMNLERGQGPERPGAVISDVIGEIAQRINLVDQQLNEALTHVEVDVEVATADRMESQMSSLRRRAALLRRYLAPQKEAMFRLQQYRGELLQSQDRQEIQAHADSMVQCLEDIDLVREQTMALQDELFNRLAMAQNARMYVLSIVAAIFLPMTFLTGLLGMNVGGIPLAMSPVGFAVIAGLSILMAIGLWLLFKRTRWL